MPDCNYSLHITPGCKLFRREAMFNINLYTYMVLGTQRVLNSCREKKIITYTSPYVGCGNKNQTTTSFLATSIPLKYKDSTMYDLIQPPAPFSCVLHQSRTGIGVTISKDYGAGKVANIVWGSLVWYRELWKLWSTRKCLTQFMQFKIYKKDCVGQGRETLSLHRL